MGETCLVAEYLSDSDAHRRRTSGVISERGVRKRRRKTCPDTGFDRDARFAPTIGIRRTGGMVQRQAPGVVR